VPGAGGTGTLNVKHAGLPSGGVMVTLDNSLFALNGTNQITAAVGANRLLFNLFPNENFPSGLCSEKAGMPDPDVWTFEYTGPTADGYRINSYTAPPSSGADCLTCRSRRLGSSTGHAIIPPAFMSPVLPEVGRISIDFMFVLDNSYSMSSLVPGTTNEKMGVLRDAVAQSIGLLQSETRAHPFDRLGVVWFSTIVTDSGLIERGPLAGGAVAWNPLKPITTPTPDDETAMGDGISRAIKLSQDSDPLLKNDAVIVLVTDGMQTVGKKILYGSELSPPLPAPENVMTYFNNINLSPPGGSYDALRKQCITVQSIGVGVPGAEFLGKLNRISEETGGTMNVSINGTGMSTAAMNLIVEALKGNTMTKVTEVNSSLASGTASAPPVSFELSNAVRRVIVALNWEGTTPSGGMQLQINRPGGGAAPIAQRYDGNGYTLQSVDIPAGGPPGTWSVTASRAGGAREWTLDRGTARRRRGRAFAT